MPRTFVWHPSRGPKKAPSFKLPKSGKVQIKQIRSVLTVVDGRIVHNSGLAKA